MKIKKIFLATALIFVLTSSCTKKIQLENNYQNTIELNYQILPNKEYTINRLFWSRTSSHQYSNESKNSYEFKINTKNFEKITINTIDTSFHFRSYGLSHPIRANFDIFDMFDQGGKEGPTICHTINGRTLIQSDSIFQSKHMNSYNFTAISTWNTQEKLPNALRLGEPFQNHDNEFECFNIIINNTFLLDSVQNGIGYINFDSEVLNYDSIPNLIQKEYGRLEYDIKNKFFKRIEKYIDHNPNKSKYSNSDIRIRLENYPSHDIINISVSK